MTGDGAGLTPTDSRYRALLEASDAIVHEPTVEALLHSFRDVLSKISGVDGTELYLLNEDGKTFKLFAFHRPADAVQVRAGTEVSWSGAAARVMEEKKPVYIADLPQEMMRIPELAPYADRVRARSGYLFPVFTARKAYGFLAFIKEQSCDFLAEDVRLMNSISSHVAVALETALATARAEGYQRELAQERDRLRLLLEINNHLVSKLDLHELFHSALTSLRSYFGNCLTGLWLLEKASNQLQNVVLDFPGSHGALSELRTTQLTDLEHEKLRHRQCEIWSPNEFPASVAAALRACSISSVAVSPLVTESGPLGLLALGSRQLTAFKPEDLDLLAQISTQIALALDNALAYGRLNASAARLEQERLYLESEIQSQHNFEDIVGKSPALRGVLDQVAIVASSVSTVLLQGETGTGKELVARAIHNLSPRRERTFVRLNCAAIPSGLVESELFGHERGAFTGALSQKRGRFELADSGTLFLDEIGDLSLELQPKLLRALQEHEFERLGSTKTIKVDVRLIAATHRDLRRLIQTGLFREDLYYRLNVFPIEIPPLRQRREDIPLLVHYFVSRLSRQMRKHIRFVPKEAMEALASYDWPGNIRELENFIERCVILTQGDELHVPTADLKKPSGRVALSAGSTLEQAEREAIINALK